MNAIQQLIEAKTLDSAKAIGDFTVEEINRLIINNANLDALLFKVFLLKNLLLQEDKQDTLSNKLKEQYTWLLDALINKKAELKKINENDSKYEKFCKNVIIETNTKFQNYKLYTQKIRELLDGLELGYSLLQRKLDQLKCEDEITQKKRKLLLNAMGNADEDFVNSEHLNVSFLSLIAATKELLHSVEPISIDQIDNLSCQFGQLVTGKIIYPLKKYDEERPFLKRITEWASDLFKRI